MSTESLAHQRAITPEDGADKPFLFYSLTLANDRRYGREHFWLLVLHRWGDAVALANLMARVDRGRS